MNKKIVAIFMSTIFAVSSCFPAFAETKTVTVGSNVIIPTKDIVLGGATSSHEVLKEFGEDQENVTVDMSKIDSNMSELLKENLPGYYSALINAGKENGGSSSLTNINPESMGFTMSEEDFLNYLSKKKGDLAEKYKSKVEELRKQSKKKYDEAVSLLKQINKDQLEALERKKKQAEIDQQKIRDSYKAEMLEAYKRWREQFSELLEKMSGDDSSMRKEMNEFEQRRIAECEERHMSYLVENYSHEIPESEYENDKPITNGGDAQHLMTCAFCGKPYGFYKSCDCGKTMNLGTGMTEKTGGIAGFFKGDSFLERVNGLDSEGNLTYAYRGDESDLYAFSCKKCGATMKGFGGYVSGGSYICPSCARSDSGIQSGTSDAVKVVPVRYDCYNDDTRKLDSMKVDGGFDPNPMFDAVEKYLTQDDAVPEDIAEMLTSQYKEAYESQLNNYAHLEERAAKLDPEAKAFWNEHGGYSPDMCSMMDIRRLEHYQDSKDHVVYQEKIESTLVDIPESACSNIELNPEAKGTSDLYICKKCGQTLGAGNSCLCGITLRGIDNVMDSKKGLIEGVMDWTASKLSGQNSSPMKKGDENYDIGNYEADAKSSSYICKNCGGSFSAEDKCGCGYSLNDRMKEDRYRKTKEFDSWASENRKIFNYSKGNVSFDKNGYAVFDLSDETNKNMYRGLAGTEIIKGTLNGKEYEYSYTVPEGVSDSSGIKVKTDGKAYITCCSCNRVLKRSEIQDWSIDVDLWVCPECTHGINSNNDMEFHSSNSELDKIFNDPSYGGNGSDVIRELSAKIKNGVLRSTGGNEAFADNDFLRNAVIFCGLRGVYEGETVSGEYIGPTEEEKSYANIPKYVEEMKNSVDWDTLKDMIIAMFAFQRDPLSFADENFDPDSIPYSYEDLIKKQKELQKQDSLIGKHPNWQEEADKLIKDSKEFREYQKYIFGDYDQDYSKWTQGMKDFYESCKNKYDNNALLKEMEQAGVFGTNDLNEQLAILEGMTAGETTIDSTVTVTPTVEWNDEVRDKNVIEYLTTGLGKVVEVNLNTHETRTCIENFDINTPALWNAHQVGTFQLKRIVPVYTFKCQKVTRTCTVSWVANYKGNKFDLDGKMEYRSERLDILGTNEQKPFYPNITPITIQVVEGNSYIDLNDYATERVSNDLVGSR